MDTQRLAGVPRSLKLQYSKPRSKKDGLGKDIPDSYETDADGNIKIDELIQEVKLVLPGEGWSAHALDIGELLAAQHRVFANQAEQAEGKKDTNELGSALYMSHNHFHAQVQSLYYINDKERIYMDSSASERIYAFENSLPQLTTEQEDLIYEDFFGYFTSSPASIRRALRGLNPDKSAPTLV
jgi:hypothetical protein